MTGDIETQITLNEKDLHELISLLQRTKYFSASVTEAFKFDKSNDNTVARMAFDASGHLYQSSSYLLSLFEDFGLVEKA